MSRVIRLPPLTIVLSPTRLELVECRSAAEDGVVAHAHMARDKDGVGDHDAIADRAVVSDVASRHQQAVLADLRHGIAVRPPVDGHALPDARAGSHAHVRGRDPVKLEVLGVAAQDGKWMDDHPVSEDRPASHDGVGVDLAAGSEPGSLFDDCGGMNGIRHRGEISKKGAGRTAGSRPGSGARARPGIDPCQTAGASAGRVVSALGRPERFPVGRSSWVSLSRS